MPDTQAAYRGLKPQTALMRAASRMSRTIDPRQPRKLNLAQQAEVDHYPAVRLLCRRLKSLLQTCEDQKRSIASEMESYYMITIDKPTKLIVICDGDMRKFF